MKRRNVLIGLGAVTAASSSVLGTGAFSSATLQRDVTIAVVGDADAFVELGPCLESTGENNEDGDGDEPEPTPNGEAFVTEEDGQMAIQITEDAEPEGGGEGVNEGTKTYLDNVFRVCNNGTQRICVDFEADLEDDDEDRVAFYPGSNRDHEISLSDLDPGGDEEEATVTPLEPGECQCFGIKINTEELTTNDELFDDGRLRISALRCAAPEDEDGEDDDKKEDDTPKEISWVAFRGSNGLESDDVEITDEKGDGELITVDWSAEDDVAEVVVKAGTNYFRFDVDDEKSGTADSKPDGDCDAFKKDQGGGQRFVFHDDPEGDEERCPSSPFLGEAGVKIEYNEQSFYSKHETKARCGGNGNGNNSGNPGNGNNPQQRKQQP